MITLTPRQQHIVSGFAHFKDTGIIPYVRCEKDDDDLWALFGAGFVKIESRMVHEKAHYGETYYECSPIFDSMLAIAEVAALLGITERQVQRRLHNHQNDPDGFPMPTDGFWSKSDIVQYAQRRYARKFSYKAEQEGGAS